MGCTKHKTENRYDTNTGINRHKYGHQPARNTNKGTLSVWMKTGFLKSDIDRAEIQNIVFFLEQWDEENDDGDFVALLLLLMLVMMLVMIMITMRMLKLMMVTKIRLPCCCVGSKMLLTGSECPSHSHSYPSYHQSSSSALSCHYIIIITTSLPMVISHIITSSSFNSPSPTPHCHPLPHDLHFSSC